MRIDRIHITEYGGWSNRNLELFEGFQVITGLNEEGKTTLLAFIRGVLFGFKFALPHIGIRSAPFFTEGKQMGGRLEITSHQDGQPRQFEIIREVSTKQDGDLSIRDANSNRLVSGKEAERLRNHILGDVDRTLFNNVFVLTVDDLHDLKALTQDEVAHALFSADSGLGLELPRELKTLRDEMDALYNPDHRRGKQRIRGLVITIKDLKSEIKELTLKMRESSGDRGNREKMSDRLEGLRKTRSGLALDVKVASDRIKARVHKSNIDSLASTVDEMSEGPFPTSSDNERLSALRDQITSAEDELEECVEEIESLEKLQTELVLDPKAEGQHSTLQVVRVADLVERVAEVESAAELRTEIAELSDIELDAGFESKFKEAFERLHETKSKLIDLEENASVAKTSLENCEPLMLETGLANETQEALTRRISDYDEPLGAAEALVVRCRADLDSALKSAGGINADDLANLPLDPASISRLRAPMTQSNDGQQVEPPTVQTLIALTSLFIGLGFILIKNDILGGGIMAIFGLVLLLSGRAKPLPVGTSVAPSKDVVKQLNLLGLSPAASVDDLDRMVNRLGEANQQSIDLGRAVNHLEETKTIAKKGLDLLCRLAADCNLETGEETTSAAHLEGVLSTRIETHREASAESKVHREELQKIEVEQGVMTKQKREQSEVCDALLEELSVDDQEEARVMIREVLRRAEIEDKLSRLATAESIVEQVQDAVGKSCKAVKEKIPALTNLAKIYAIHADRAEKAEAIRAEYDGLEKKLIDLRPRAERRGKKKEGLETKGAELLASVNVASDEAFKVAVEVGMARSKVEAELKDEQRQFDAIASNWEDFEVKLEAVDPTDDELTISEQERRDEDLTDEISRLQGELDNLNAELRNLDESDELTRLQSERVATKARLDETHSRWAELFLVRAIIERAREQYEGDHGSEVLRRASEHLEKMTDGRYTQIMRIVEEPGYQLLQADGTYRTPIPPDVSRAAFAQVYLSIRLAYAERGSHAGLPVILDDALEGFDNVRMPLALDILKEIAENRQVLLFSHHGHIAEAASELGVPVIEL